MKQYNAVKAEHPDAILLFRVGDFYETFSDDAIKASKILGITLTKRANGAASFVELAGFPFHAIDTYLPKLVRAGQRVAICEQLEDPKLTKKIVKRGVTELVTPGVSLNDNVLEHKENNFLASLYFEKKMAGVSFLDISTGEFLVAEGNFEYIDKLLSSLNPKEVLLERSKEELFTQVFGNRYYTFCLEDWVYTPESANDRLLKHFETKSLKGFGINKLDMGIISAGAVFHYLDITKHHKIDHISRLSRIEEEKYVWLDKFTIRNLEIFNSINEGAITLFEVMDKTISPMGARLLRRWLALPLKEIRLIEERQNIVEHCLKDINFQTELSENIKNIGDLERIVSKVSVGRISPREVVQLKNALKAIDPVKRACETSVDKGLIKIGEQLNPCPSVIKKIETELLPDPPHQINKGKVIAKGVSKELDELREIAFSGKDYLLRMQEEEIKKTLIPSLKIGFNNVFGYYFEVRNMHKDKVPESWVRKQTLVSAERYINEELKKYESSILGAEEKILNIETELFNELVLSLMDYVTAIQLNAGLIARLDCLLSFSFVASENKYFRPEINDSEIISIKSGRHPVIEHQLPAGEEYIPNDVYLDNEEQQVIIIPGPNMAGKSALLRQTALIVLLAQTGSFVPAEKAEIGVVDKIFTRVGASDNISLGESTFMVEMNEAASILNNISSRSLILFDELGRGTSTYDGISIAWAIVEYIHEHPSARAKTLFATHYHELNEMEKSYNRIKNFNVSVKEVNNKIIFLRKLVRGGSAHSFGIHVARMAGMPKSIVKRSDEILAELESAAPQGKLVKHVDTIAQNREGYQLQIFQLDDPVLKQIRDEINNMDIDHLTPIEALNKLNEIKGIVGSKKK